jgi:glutathione S-transferase
MEYKSVKEARALPGTRLALSVGVPGPWGQAAKKMLEYKKIPYVPVAQHVAEANEDLVAWTGHRNAPVLVHDNDPPLTRWQDMIVFAEKIQPTPALVPRASKERVLMFGIVNELAGEWGYGWCRRLMMLHDQVVAAQAKGDGMPSATQVLTSQYGYSSPDAIAAEERCAEILRMLTEQLKSQREWGSEFVVGAALSAADIYWACFSSMLEPLPDDILPMSQEMRAFRTVRSPVLLAAKDPILIDQRDRIFRAYLGPMSF